MVDSQTGKKLLPHVIEPAVGVNRLFLMALSDAYCEEEGRVVLKLSPKIAPFTVAVFPLLANKEELVSKAGEIHKTLKRVFHATVDARGNIGKRYLSQDEIGTPYCVTVDFDTLTDNMVTVRDRDTKDQERVLISNLISFIQGKMESWGK